MDFDEDQIRTAKELGYGDGPAAALAMNREHDQLHGSLTYFLGVPTYSLQDGVGIELEPWQRELSLIEEAAVLAVQRLRQMHRVLGPR